MCHAMNTGVWLLNSVGRVHNLVLSYLMYSLPTSEVLLMTSSGNLFAGNLMKSNCPDCQRNWNSVAIRWRPAEHGAVVNLHEPANVDRIVWHTERLFCQRFTKFRDGAPIQVLFHHRIHHQMRLRVRPLFTRLAFKGGI